ncbi:hypothetical protein A3715_26605 [Oleiphilus sp. HI0009]|nr:MULTISPECIES: FecR domain-containing protein [unclassified Oleiphilus]KZX77760.1 hypothetical protein A3715_11105 [Oleiphilus sp. HI0009]KZX86441.1 hypothetical protein A3715_26605 [Oleiphilus sp. HI0009]KZY66471.1 hypothetical protein A3738_06340 [Oleiphilus sp. HI0066]KZY68987.1 hypothetical protein A3739_09955 [Oleiphilus sp. HI0067]
MNGPVQSVHHRLTLIFAASFVALALTLTSPSINAESYDGYQNLDWHYTVRPNDSLKDVAERLLKRQYSWTSISHYNRLKDVENLQVGSIIKVPISWLKYQPRPAKIISSEGLALIKRRQETRYHAIKSNTQIYVGDELLTRDGKITVQFADNSTVKLDPHSHLIFNKLSKYEDVGMVDTRMRLSRGGLRTTVSPLVNGSRYEISTPSAVAAVRGTDFRLRSSLMGTTLEVLEGKVEFFYDHGRQMIESGDGVRTIVGRENLERINLFNLPRFKASSDLSNISDAEETLNWRGLPADLNVEDKNASFKASGASVDTKDDESASQVQTNDEEVNQDPDAATLDLPLPGSIVDAFTAEFSWEVKHPETLSRFELSKTDDFKRLALPTKWSENTSYRLEDSIAAGNYFWRVRTLSAGKAEATSAARAVSIQGKLDVVNILTVNYIGDQVGIFWHTVDNAQGYVLQISDDKEFRRLLKEETLSKTRAFLKLPEGKHFYARVKGLGDEIFSSEFGPHKDILLEPTPQ